LLDKLGYKIGEISVKEVQWYWPSQETCKPRPSVSFEGDD